MKSDLFVTECFAAGVVALPSSPPSHPTLRRCLASPCPNIVRASVSVRISVGVRRLGRDAESRAVELEGDVSTLGQLDHGS